MCKQNPATHKWDNILWSNWIGSRSTILLQCLQNASVRLLIEQRKTCMAISTDAEKPFNAIHIHYDKYSQESRAGREPPYLQQICS